MDVEIHINWMLLGFNALAGIFGVGYLVTWLLGCLVAWLGQGCWGKGWEVLGTGYWVLGIGRGAVRRALGGGAPNFLTS